MLKPLCTALLICCSVLQLYAQSAAKSNLLVVTNKSNTVVYIDTLKIPARQIVNSSAGKHRLRIWAPTMRLVDTTVDLKENSMRVFRQRLVHTENYLNFKKSLHKYERRRAGMLFCKYGAAPIALGLLVAGTIEMGHYKHEMNECIADAKAAQYTYSNTISKSLMDKSIEEYAVSKRRYDNALKMYNYYSAGRIVLFLAGAGITYYVWKKEWNLYKPLFGEKVPLATIRLDLNSSLVYSGISLKAQF